MESLIGLSYKNYTKKLLVWSSLMTHREPVFIDQDKKIPCFFVLGMKFWKDDENDDIYAVYTNSEMYKDISEEDLDLIINDGVISAVKKIATKTAWEKVKSIRERIYLNHSRGAFKKVTSLRHEMKNHIRYMRNLKTTENIFTIQ